jgi:hypothetical protein
LLKVLRILHLPKMEVLPPPVALGVTRMAKSERTTRKSEM